MDPALLDRFVTWDLVPTHQDWLNWAQSEGIDDVAIDFLRNHPEHLRPTKAVEPGSITPTQRSWARLLATLKSADMAPSKFAGESLPPGFHAICMGYIGVATAIAFQDFIKSYDSVMTAEDILDRWSKSKSKVAKLPAEKVLGLVEKIGNACKESELTLGQVKNLGEFGNAITGEQLMSLWQAVSTGKQANVVKFHGFIKERLITIATKANSTKK
jgi:hypothetical protein